MSLLLRTNKLLSHFRSFLQLRVFHRRYDNRPYHTKVKFFALTWFYFNTLWDVLLDGKDTNGNLM